MSRLNEMLRELCPAGVEYVKLGEIGKFYGGLTGKTKDDFTSGNAVFISYKNVYTNPSVDQNVKEKVKIAVGEKQRTLEYGDVIFTGSSETPEECGLSSVVTEKPTEPLYLNSFCFFFRFNDLSAIEPMFAKHLFRSENLRYQIGKTASGVTRYNVSKKLMEKVSIPLPPLPIQHEIVRILDAFTSLTAELTAELTARKRQYAYYRDRLLTFGDEVPRVRLGEVCKITRGRVISKDYIEENKGKYPVYSSQTENNGELGRISSYDHVGEYVTWITDGANAGSVFYRNGRFSVTNVCGLLKIKSKISAKYVYYTLQIEARKYVNKGMGNPKLMSNVIAKISIPLPPLQEQNRIASILDRFDALCNDLTDGLPAEIAARKKQYAYYRDKLLTFETGE